MGIHAEDSDIKEALSGRLTTIREHRTRLEGEIVKQEREITGLEQMIKVYQKTPEFGNAANPKEQLGTTRLAVCALKQQLCRAIAMDSIIGGAGIVAAVKPSLAPRSPVHSASPQSNAEIAANLTAALNTIRSSSPRTPPPALQAVFTPISDTPAVGKFVQALFEYTKQADDELSFVPGTIIKVLEGGGQGQASDNPEWMHGQYEDELGVLHSGLFPLVYTKPFHGLVGGKMANSSSTVMSEESLPTSALNNEPPTSSKNQGKLYENSF